MDVVIIFNGLGNQMSQYAFYLQKKTLNKNTFYVPMCKVHDGLQLNNAFGLNIQNSIFRSFLLYIYKTLRAKKLIVVIGPVKAILTFLNLKVVDENFDYNFKSKFLLPSKYLTYYFGGWHSEKYFLDVKQQLLKDFKFKSVEDGDNKMIIDSIKNSNSISIHIRRGDYLTAENYAMFGEVCNKGYYDKAISIINERVHDPHFFVFSNDFSWAERNLNFANVTYVKLNSGVNSWKDMFLMTICKHNIIANSTFSWWGAWLNLNPQKLVICPNRFLNNDSQTDVYPDSWLKLSDY